MKKNKKIKKIKKKYIPLLQKQLTYGISKG
jgi:hypothetical protein